jgi:hypothetical protein
LFDDLPTNNYRLPISLLLYLYTAPAFSHFATALKGTNTLQQGALPSYRRLSNAYGEQLDENWVDTAYYIPFKLQGDISLYDADLIIVKIVPNTGPSELANNTTPAASPQGQSPLA